MKDQIIIVVENQNSPSPVPVKNKQENTNKKQKTKPIPPTPIPCPPVTPTPPEPKKITDIDIDILKEFKLSNEIPLFYLSRIVAKIGLIIFLIYCAGVAIRMYKIHFQLGIFYRSRADFFQILDDKKEIDPKELIAILTPDLKLEKEEFPLNQTIEIASKIKKLVDDLMGIFPNKEDKSKEEKKE